MKVGHPGQIGVPNWWRLAVWPITAVGVLLVVEGVVGAVTESVSGLQLTLIGLLVAVLPWSNAIALGTARPGWVTVRGALARRVARRFRYLAAFVALLAVAAAVVAAFDARDSGPGVLVAVAPLLTVTFLLLASALWLRARLIDSWA